MLRLLLLASIFLPISAECQVHKEGFWDHIQCRRDFDENNWLTAAVDHNESGKPIHFTSLRTKKVGKGKFFESQPCAVDGIKKKQTIVKKIKSNISISYEGKSVGFLNCGFQIKVFNKPTNRQYPAVFRFYSLDKNRRIRVSKSYGMRCKRFIKSKNDLFHKEVPISFKKGF